MAATVQLDERLTIPLIVQKYSSWKKKKKLFVKFEIEKHQLNQQELNTMSQWESYSNFPSQWKKKNKLETCYSERFWNIRRNGCNGSGIFIIFCERHSENWLNIIFGM